MKDKNRVEQAIKYLQDWLPKIGVPYLGKDGFYFIEGNDEIFGICPSGTTCEKLFDTINTNDIMPFYWEGEKLIAI